MRRYPLIDRIARGSVRPALIVALVLGLPGCQAPAPSATPPVDGVHVAIETAAGDTLAFEPALITVDVVAPLTVTFRNRSTLPHNMVFTDGLSASTRTIVEPGTSDEVRLEPDGPGTYRFVCTIHAGMAGSLVVGGAVS